MLDPTIPTDDAAYYRAILHDLIDRGADLARRVHESATAATPTLENRPEADPIIAFDRIARTIRRTIALARHIAAHPEATTQPNRTTVRTRIIRTVEDAIHRRRAETDADALYAEFNERLADPELELDLQGRPVEAIIQEICQDLGVAAQGRSYIYKRRRPHDIAAIRTRAAATAQPALHLIQGGRPNPAPLPPLPKGKSRAEGEGRGEGAQRSTNAPPGKPG